jgi:glycerol-3-phosphate O-acyltransferase / dihydroxyacetone phosphate acyltransferase
LFYWLLKLFVYFSLKIFYKIDVKGLNKIPRNKPIILAPNHSNGFIDPVILAKLPPQKVRFFARGDVFKGAFAKWILNKMNVSPMYRMQDGFAELKKNDKSFEECRNLLSANKTILIFPEGLCIQERRLRHLKKGLTRIAFQTLESLDYSKDIFVIPVGINYLAAPKFRSKVFIDIGNPISMKEYEGNYKADKVKAINEFTKILEEKLLEKVSNINNAHNDILVSNIEEVYTHKWLVDKNLNSLKIRNQGIASSEIVEMVNVLDEKDPELLASLKSKIYPYIKLLNENNLRDHLLREENINKMNLGTFVLEYIIVYIGAPLYFVGLLLNYPPYLIAEKFAWKKVKKAEFYASFRANLSLIFWTIYLFIQLTIVGIVFKSWFLLLIFILLAALTGFYVLEFYPVLKKIQGRWKLLRMVRKDRVTIEKIVNLRTEVMAELDRAKKKYLSSVKG